jgi:hypothetical protein
MLKTTEGKALDLKIPTMFILLYCFRQVYTEFLVVRATTIAYRVDTGRCAVEILDG